MSTTWYRISEQARKELRYYYQSIEDAINRGDTVTALATIDEARKNFNKLVHIDDEKW
ncbi:hypothetical protein [Lacticaseibacillus paracasei]|uniref:hypothetical protein n=1 Tax=Lacticaseibacillus paracasei TaxID=1597 RepID=UPI003BA32938